MKRVFAWAITSSFMDVDQSLSLNFTRMLKWWREEAGAAGIVLSAFRNNFSLLDNLMGNYRT